MSLGFIEFIFLIAPLAIQLILYHIAKLCFKKIRSHKIYSACLVVNTILLFIIKIWYLSSQDPSEMEPMDAFDGIIITMLWAPWYIGVLISCIIRNVIAKKSDKKDEIDLNKAYSELNSKGKKFMHENDNYDRKEMIRMTSKVFGEEMTEEELDKRAKLWYLADNSTDADVLSKLSESKYVEVREGVAGNENTSVETLISLSKDDDWEVRETVVFHSKTPQNIIDELKNDENDFVREATLRREKLNSDNKES